MKLSSYTFWSLSVTQFSSGLGFMIMLLYYKFLYKCASKPKITNNYSPG